MKGKPWNKKTISIVAIALAAIALTIGALAIALPGANGMKTYQGYLICQHCGLNGFCAPGNVDLSAHPEKHTLKCLKDPDCILSGYGIAVKQDKGKYTFYPFDAAGSAKALSGIVYNTKRADNLLVEVRGKLEKGTLKVESIEEK